MGSYLKGKCAAHARVSKRDVSRAIRERGVSVVEGLAVREIMGEPFPSVGVDTPVDVVIPLLMHHPAVLTTRKGEAVRIVTNSDIGVLFCLLNSGS